MAIRCALCGKPMPCGHRSCDRRKEAVHAPAMELTRPRSDKRRVYSMARATGRK